MAHFTLAEANAWSESSKMALDTIDSSLEAQVAALVLNKLSPVYDVSTWTNDTSTPQLVRSIIAMEYVAWVYDKTYAEDTGEANPYATLLRQTAEANIQGLLTGVVILPEAPEATTDNTVPSFYPNDLSSASEPTTENPSDGGPAFMMGTVF